MSHAIDMAQFLCGPIRRVVATKETFVQRAPAAGPGQRHPLRPWQARRPDGRRHQRGLRRRAGRVRERGPRHARGGSLDLRAAELDGVRAQRVEGRRVVGPRDAQPAPTVPAGGAADRRVHRGARPVTHSRTRGPSCRAAATRSATRTSSSSRRWNSCARSRPAASTARASPTRWPTPRSPRRWSARGRRGRWEDVISLRHRLRERRC